MVLLKIIYRILYINPDASKRIHIFIWLLKITFDIALRNSILISKTGNLVEYENIIVKIKLANK